MLRGTEICAGISGSEAGGGGYGGSFGGDFEELPVKSVSP